MSFTDQEQISLLDSKFHIQFKDWNFLFKMNVDYCHMVVKIQRQKITCKLTKLFITAICLIYKTDFFPLLFPGIFLIQKQHDQLVLRIILWSFRNTKLLMSKNTCNNILLSKNKSDASSGQRVAYFVSVL